MKRAFVLINTRPGTEAVLERELKKVEGVVGVYLVYGAYDVVVALEAESEEELRDIVLLQIRALKYLKSTITLSVVP